MTARESFTGGRSEAVNQVRSVVNRLVKYADPDHYRTFLDELLQRSTKTAMNCDISIESTGGKL